MAEYIAREWSNGDIVTASNLNSMEQGITEAQNDESGSDVLIIRQDTEASTSERVVYDKTWQEVFDALKVGTRVVLLEEDDLPPYVANTNVAVARNDTSVGAEAPYEVCENGGTTSRIAQADTADGYLYAESGDTTN